MSKTNQPINIAIHRPDGEKEVKQCNTTSDILKLGINYNNIKRIRDGETYVTSGKMVKYGFERGTRIVREDVVPSQLPKNDIIEITIRVENSNGHDGEYVINNSNRGRYNINGYSFDRLRRGKVVMSKRTTFGSGSKMYRTDLSLEDINKQKPYKPRKWSMLCNVMTVDGEVTECKFDQDNGNGLSLLRIRELKRGLIVTVKNETRDSNIKSGSIVYRVCGDNTPSQDDIESAFNDMVNTVVVTLPNGEVREIKYVTKAHLHAHNIPLECARRQSVVFKHETKNWPKGTMLEFRK